MGGLLQWFLGLSVIGRFCVIVAAAFLISLLVTRQVGFALDQAKPEQASTVRIMPWLFTVGGGVMTAVGVGMILRPSLMHFSGTAGQEWIFLLIAATVFFGGVQLVVRRKGSL